MAIDVGEIQRNGVPELESVEEVQLGVQSGDDLVGAAASARHIEHSDRVRLLVVNACVRDKVRHTGGVPYDVRIAFRIEGLVLLLSLRVGVDWIQRGHSEG